MAKLNNFCSGHRGAYCQTLFDPIQTHAVYGIPKSNKETIKLELKALGAKKFRIVNANSSAFIIVCFDASKMAPTQE